MGSSTIFNALAPPPQFNAINKGGQIVGDYNDSNGGIHGFLYSGGQYVTLNDPLGTAGTIALGINRFGQIVGDYGDSSGHQHGFLYTGGKYITLDDPLGTSTVATGINDRGQIVGYYTDSAGDFQRPRRNRDGLVFSGGGPQSDANKGLLSKTAACFLQLARNCAKEDVADLYCLLDVSAVSDVPAWLEDRSWLCRRKSVAETREA
jgi:probable HAF family extracellular repeat protein